MIFLLMLCITGLPLIFHEEIDDLLETEVTAPVLPAGTPLASLDRIIAAGRAYAPGHAILFLSLRPHDPDVVALGMSPTPTPKPAQFSRVSIDARTAQVLNETAPRRGGVMHMILTLHKDMFLGLPGELFLGFMGLVAAASVISGIVIYAPFMRRIDFGTIRKTSNRVKWIDLHNLFGIVTVIWVLVVFVTGTINTLAIPLYDLYRAQALPPLLKPYQGKPVAQINALDDAVRRVRTANPDRIVTSVTMPTALRSGSPQHFVVWTKGNSPFTAKLAEPVLVDVSSGEIVHAPPMPWYLQALQVARPLHFGDYGGLPFKIVWAALDVVAIIVLGSGLYLWVARVFRRSSPAPTVGVAPPAAGTARRNARA